MCCTMNNEIFSKVFQLAKNHADNNTRCMHLGCGIVINGELVVIETNSKEAHAEMNAVDKLMNELEALVQCESVEVDLVVFRSRKDGTAAISKPCFNCLQHLRTYKFLRYIHYFDRSGIINTEHIGEIFNTHMSGKVMKQIRLQAALSMA